jgi:hypothetical protein
VPGSARGRKRPLPAEHGARFIPGIYQNLPDTMRRIPFGSSPNGTFDNLVAASQDTYARSGGREDWNISFTPTDTRPWTFEQFRETLIASLEIGTHLPPQEVAFFVDRLYVFFSSCDARRFGEWERMSWWDFVAAEHFSEDYQRLLISSATRLVLGSKATEACARTLGLLWEAGVYNFFGRGANGPWDRVLNAPTNEALIDPWLAHLRSLASSCTWAPRSSDSSCAAAGLPARKYVIAAHSSTSSRTGSSSPCRLSAREGCSHRRSSARIRTLKDSTRSSRAG